MRKHVNCTPTMKLKLHKSSNDLNHIEYFGSESVINQTQTGGGPLEEKDLGISPSGHSLDQSNAAFIDGMNDSGS